MENSFFLNSTSGVRLFVRKWVSEDVEAKAVLIVEHGMSEHSARYANFANFLNDKGFIVYADDHRGHGQTAGSVEELGYFSDKNGWSKVLEDINNLHHHALKEHPKLPVFILGHSMGSLLLRHYVQIYPDMEISGAIVMGTATDPGLLRVAGLGLTNLLALFFGKKSKSKFADYMSFGSFNDKFRPNRTLSDWLSRDEEAVDEYIADPYCGTISTLGFWIDFLTGIGKLSSRSAIRRTPSELPILFMAGDMDPVGDFGKGVKAVYERYKRAKIQDLELKLYAGARHELLNELNRNEVYLKIYDWMEQRM